MTDDMLRTLGLADHLSPVSASRLTELAVLSAWPEQAVLFRERESHERFYWIQAGRVRLEMSGKRGGNTAMLTIASGDLLAWSALVGDRRMTATATTIEPTSLFAFEAAAFLQLCNEHPEIGYRVMQAVARRVSQRLTATRLQMLDLFHQPTELVP